MKKIIRMFLFLFGIAILFSGTANAYEAKPTTIKLIINNKPAETVETYASNLREFFDEQGIKIGAVDKVTPSMESSIVTNLVISIDRFNEVTLTIDGKDTKIAVKGGTVDKIIADYSKETGEEYEYDKILSPLTVVDGTMIELKSKKIENIQTIEEVAFETETVPNPELEYDKKNVLTDGVTGKRKIVEKVVYLSGKEISREIVSDEIIEFPVKEVVEIGTAETVGGYKYEKELTMSATAYTANYACTGKNPGDYNFGITASGMKAERGVVAVDPAVIPIGTELYIPGYGYAVAGDTGSAIKGNKIDLYLDSYSECLSFGRRNIQVYVLG